MSKDGGDPGDDGRSGERGQAGTRIDGLGAAAEILNGLEPEHRRRILQELEGRDPGLTRKIEDRMFGFDDLVGLSDLDLKALLREVPHTKLVLALRRASEALHEAIYRNMTSRGGEALRDEVQGQGPKRVSDIVAAQADIVRIALTLRR